MNTARKIKKITMEEFEKMDKDERITYEFIDGVVMMSPSPSREHQGIGAQLVTRLVNLLSIKQCSVFYELDIRSGENIFRPDVMVFCDKEAEIPEIVFEILSPSTKNVDLGIKVIKYQEAGIKEYWIIDPKVKSITVHTYTENKTETYGVDEIAVSLIYPEIQIPVKDILGF